MIKLTYICDHCSVEVEKKLDSPLELDRANWRNAPDRWESVGIDDKVLFLCPDCNGSVVSQKDQIKALEASIKTDVAAAVVKVEG
jgi:uncharacterized protein YlaI